MFTINPVAVCRQLTEPASNDLHPSFVNNISTNSTFNRRRHGNAMAMSSRALRRTRDAKRDARLKHSEMNTKRTRRRVAGRRREIEAQTTNPEMAMDGLREVLKMEKAESVDMLLMPSASASKVIADVLNRWVLRTHHQPRDSPRLPALRRTLTRSRSRHHPTYSPMFLQREALGYVDIVFAGRPISHALSAVLLSPTNASSGIYTHTRGCVLRCPPRSRL